MGEARGTFRPGSQTSKMCARKSAVTAGPPPCRDGDAGVPPRGRNWGGQAGGGPGLTVLGIAFNGVNSEPPAPVDVILAAHTFAPFDEAGGHINPHIGYHHHAGAAGENQIIRGFGGTPGIMTITD